MGPEPRDPPANLKRQAIRGFVWSVVSSGSERLVGFLVTVLLARLLLPREFGVAMAAIVLVTAFDVILDLGVGAALIYEQEHGVTARVQTAFMINAVMSAGLTVIGIAAAPGVARFFGAPGQDAIFRAVFCAVLIRGLGQVHDAVLRRDLQFRRRMVATTCRALIRAAVTVPLALAGLGAWALVWGFLAGELARTVASWCLVTLRPRLAFDRSAAGMLVRFGTTVVTVRALEWVTINVDYLVVGKVLGPAALGVYVIAYRIPELLVENVLGLFSSVAFPTYAQARQEGPDVLRQTMLRALTLVSLFGFPVAVTVALAARDMVAVFFPERWASAAGPMALIALALGIDAVTYASGDLFPAIGKPGLLIRLDGVLAVVLVTAFLLVAHLGIMAIAAVHLCTLTVYSAARLFLAGRETGTGWRQAFEAMKPAVSAAVGVIAFALPVRMLMEAGALSLVVMTIAAASGGTIALLVASRRTFGEVADVLRMVMPPRSPGRK